MNIEPCPKCKKPADYYYYDEHGANKALALGCKSCGLSFAKEGNEDKEILIPHWNRIARFQPFDGIVKKLSEIRRHEWIAYRWKEITEMQDSEPRFLRGILRNPDECKDAAENWDIARSNHIAAMRDEINKNRQGKIA